MLSRHLDDRYGRAGAALDAQGWNGWLDDWTVFRDLALEPIDDLIPARYDRDEFLVEASRSYAHIPGLRLCATRSTFLDMDYEVNAAAVAFTWIWSVGDADDVPEFALFAHGSDSHVLGEPTAPPIAELVDAFQASASFEELIHVPPPQSRTFTVS